MEGPTPTDLDQSKPGWYLDLMAPNTLGPKYAWLDPSPIYCWKESLDACVDDLAKPFQKEEVDMVAGIDSVGYILGVRLAHKLGTGFLVLRKRGGHCVDTESKSYVDYQKKEKALEIRKKPFLPGTRVLIVDQWIETGGTMEAACYLVESQGGKVAGISAICIEGTEGAKQLCKKHKFSHCTPPELQKQMDDHYLESFKLYKQAK